MTTMLEKIAKALCKTDSRLHDWKSERAWIAQRSRYFDLARAALQAIREPDEAMKAAGEAVLDLPEIEPEWRRIENAGDGFTTMIDAILAEPGNPT